jgi:hypothetical protein
MASASEYAQWIVDNADKKGTPEFATVAAAYRAAKGQMTAAAPEMNLDPTAGMSWGDQAAAGVGKALVDTGRGLRQLGSYVGVGDKEAIQKEIDDAKRQDAALMATGGGMTGNVLGQIGMALAPGGMLARSGGLAAKAGQAWMLPKTVLGAGAVGATQGAVQPVASDESRLSNIAVGTAGGAALPFAIAGGKFIKSTLAPFSQGGREQVAGRALQRFAANPSGIDAAAGAPQLVPGSLPTLAEASGDTGLAQLQRLLRNNPDSNNAITERLMQNNAARADAIRGIAGDTGQREFFAASRDTAARDLYGKAFEQTPELTPWVKGQITQLQKRPTFAQAWDEASALAADAGLAPNPSNIVQTAHFAKMALDRKIESLAKEPTAQRAVLDIKDKLVSLMESKDFAPAYREARATYAAMSKPINQMDVGEALYQKLVPALSDFGPAGRINAATFAQALRNGDQTARTATKFRGAKMDRILSPEQLQAATAVAQDLARQTGAAEQGLARGSPTAQNLIGQDIMGQVLGSFGLPKSLAATGIAETMLRPVSFAYKPMENRILGLLGDAAISPAEAKRLLDIARKRSRFAGLDNAIPYAAQPAAAGLLNLSQQ